MRREVAGVLTVGSLVALLASFPLLIQFWVVTIAKAIPSAFTLGMATVILYKGFRYPRGTAFTAVGLIQISLIGWIIFSVHQEGLTWLAVPICIAAIVVAPQSARRTWKLLRVDKYYQKDKNS